MRQLYLIIFVFDVEGVVLVVSWLSALFGLLIGFVPATTFIELVPAHVFGPVLYLFSMITLAGLMIGSRPVLLWAIPTLFYSWAVLVGTTVILYRSNAPLLTAVYMGFMLCCVWTWLRILLDPRRLLIDRQ